MSNRVQIAVEGEDRSRQAMQSAQQGGQELANSIRRVRDVAGGILAANLFQNIARTGQRAFSDMIFGAARTGDEIATMSQQLGVSNEGLQEMRFWADQNNLAHSDLDRAVGRLNQRIGRAIEGSDKYREAFERLGVSLTDNQGNVRDTEDVMRDTISALRDIEDSSIRSAAASEVFGTQVARRLLPVLSDSSVSLEDAAARAHELGVVMSDEAVGAAQEFQTSLGELKAAGQGFSQQLGTALLPALTGVTNAATTMVGALNDMPGPMGTVIPIVGAAAGGFLLLAPRIVQTHQAMQAMNISAGRFIRVAGPIGLAVGAITAGASALERVLFEDLNPNIEATAVGMQRFAETGKLSGEAARVFGDEIDGASREMRQLVSDAWWDRARTQVQDFAAAIPGTGRLFGRLSNDIEGAREEIAALDDTLAHIVQTTGDIDEAEAVLRRYAEANGLSAEEVNNLREQLVNYENAQDIANDRTEEGTEAHGNSATAIMDHANSLRDLTDALKEQTDPVFAAIQAQQRYKEAQDASTEAMNEFGENSPEHEQALLDQARANLELQGALGDVSDKVGDDLLPALRDMRDAGIISREEFKALKRVIDDTREAAERADGTRMRLRASVQGLWELERAAQLANELAVSQATGQFVPHAHGGTVGAERMQRGGIPGSSRIVVGDGVNGPEVLDVPQGTRVIPSVEQAAAEMNGLGGQTGPSITVHVHGSILSERDVIALLRNEFLTGGLSDVFTRPRLADDRED